MLTPGALTLIEVGDASMSAILELFETALFEKEVTFGSDTYLPKGAPGSTLVALTLTEPEYRRDTRDQRSKIIGGAGVTTSSSFARPELRPGAEGHPDLPADPSASCAGLDWDSPGAHRGGLFTIRLRGAKGSRDAARSGV